MANSNCADCGQPYSSMGLDLVLPGQQWKIIAPDGGILCANCICLRAEKNSAATCIHTWIDNLEDK